MSKLGVQMIPSLTMPRNIESVDLSNLLGSHLTLHTIYVVNLQRYESLRLSFLFELRNLLTQLSGPNEAIHCLSLPIRGGIWPGCSWYHRL